MKHKISKLLNDLIASKSVTKNMDHINDLVRGKYSANKSIRFKTPELRSNLCDYSDGYIVLKVLQALIMPIEEMKS